MLLLAAACGSREQRPADWVATVESTSGQVAIAETPGAVAAAAQKGQHLRVGSRLETGPASQALLLLRNGGRLTVKPNSVVSFSSNLPEKNLALALVRGAVEGKSSSVQASELVIGVGDRRVRLTAEASATVSKEKEAVFVTFGTATVEDPSGKQEKVVEGKELVLSAPMRGAAKPDAGTSATRPARSDAGVVAAAELLFYVQASGKGRVLIKRPGETRFVAVRRGEPVAIKPGTELKLVGKSTVVVAAEKGGAGTTVTGPAQLVVHEGHKDESGKTAPRIETTSGEMQIALAGKPGGAGAPFTVEGVKIATRVTHRRLDVKVRKEKGRALLTVGAGEATLVGKDRTLRLEAGQEAVLAKGKIAGPSMPPPAPLEIKSGGTMRVFSASPTIPVTFRWTPEGGTASLVEVSRSPGFDHPLFSDVIQRRALTIPAVGKGTLYWQVKPVNATGAPTGKAASGKLMVVKDTSHRVIKVQAPRNTIHESFGNTTVYYQNFVPRFTFRWEPMPEAASYQVKILREQNLAKPIIVDETRATSLTLGPGKLGEGTYIWYVAGRAGGTLIKTTKGNRLAIKYDNATPDLQIVYPPNGAAVAGDIEVKGVAIPGSRVLVNGQPATLDDTFRFTHTVRLKPGVNHIVFLVVDTRRGSSYYLRRVTRQ